MAFQWTDKETIQLYLDAVGDIQIGGNSEISDASAEIYENDAVSEIVSILSIGWEGVESLTSANASTDLKRLAAKLTAARLGTARVGGTQGQLPSWVTAFQQQVFGQVRFMVVNNKTVTITGVTRRDIPVHEMLILVKAREDILGGDAT